MACLIAMVAIGGAPPAAAKPKLALTLPAGTTLGDGFVVAEGSRLVGRVFPQPDYGSGSWLALLVFDGSPLVLYDRYAEQARHLGFPIPGSGTARGLQPTCRVEDDHGVPMPIDAATDDQVRSAHKVACDGFATATDGTERLVELSVVWGGGGPSAFDTAHASLVVRGNAPALDLPNLEPTAATPRSAFRDLTLESTKVQPGEPFGGTNNPFDSGYRRFDLVPGSRLAGPTACCVGHAFDTTVLRIDGNAIDVLRKYGRQLTGHTLEVLSTKTRGTVLSLEYGPGDGGAAVLTTDPTRKWLLIETSSD